MTAHELDADARAAQTAIWSRMSPAEKIDLTGRLWLQARNLKRATLRSLHPDWSEEQVEGAVREAMGGRGD